jgi:hypothetical protein
MTNPFIEKAQAKVETMEIVHWLDTPRFYVVDCSGPKEDGLPKTMRMIDIGQQQSNQALEDAREFYNRRIGYSVVPMYPHTHPDHKA